MRYVCLGMAREKLCPGPCCTNVEKHIVPDTCPEGFKYVKWVRVSPIHDEDWYPMWKVEALARKANDKRLL